MSTCLQYLPGTHLWLTLPSHILISFIPVLGGKPDDITVLLSIVAEYTDWLATLATPAFPLSPTFPCHVCWSCWQDHVSLPLISVTMMDDAWPMFETHWDPCWEPLLSSTSRDLLVTAKRSEVTAPFSRRFSKPFTCQKQLKFWK